jgi:hypothetical protein
MADRAQKLVERATVATGCQTPLVALNELNGPGTTTPWTRTNAQYRANVLLLLRELVARGARPFLLLPSVPYTGGEALAWWQEAGRLADIVPEVYFNAPRIHKLGPILANRRMRQAFRDAIANLTAIGIPAARIGLMLGFQSGPGAGGREGLQPTSKWLEFVKWQTLAAKQVAAELGVGTVWSWGWGTFSAAGADEDKPTAACVYLWARGDLCDGLSAAGEGFDADLEEGQIVLPPGAECVVGGTAITAGVVQQLAAVTGDSELARTALFARAVESTRARVSEERILGIEQAIVAAQHGGSRTAYLGALRNSRASLALARGVIGDALRHAQLARSLRVPAPSAAEVTRFYASFPDVEARLVEAKPAPAWLGGRTRGFVLTPAAPGGLMSLPTGSPAAMATVEGAFTVTPLEEALPLAALPIELAAPAIRAALLEFAHAAAVEAWSLVAQERALARTTCLRDDLPSPGSIDLTTFLPLGLSG